MAASFQRDTFYDNGPDYARLQQLLRYPYQSTTLLGLERRMITRSGNRPIVQLCLCLTNEWLEQLG
jgi:hypothetical protein